MKCVREGLGRPTCPQSLLDDAVAQLSNRNGMVTSELLWLCGTHALHNFGKAYGIDWTTHIAASFMVGFIAKQFGEEISDHWGILQKYFKFFYSKFYY